MTDRLKDDRWAWYGTGPGIGIQLADGRLVIPCYHSVLGAGDYQSHMIFSDDHGTTWRLGKTVSGNTSECQIAQRVDGTVYVNARTLRGTKLRTIAVSSDRAKSWSKAEFDEQLYDPPCQAALIVVSCDERPLWLFSHPAGPGRRNLTVRFSYDEGRTWKGSRKIASGDNQYSSLAVLPDGKIGCLFESWRDGNYQILFTQFELARNTSD